MAVARRRPLDLYDNLLAYKSVNRRMTTRSVAWLVHIESPSFGEAISQQPQRHARDEWFQDLRRFRNWLYEIFASY
jgi:hypothetical protein